MNYLKILFALLICCGSLHTQAQTTFLYFQDSPDPEFYDFSWMDLQAPSELERKVEPDLRRFPVESEVPAQQGSNALRLKWKSLAGGNWLAIAAGTNWAAHDISGCDSLVLWLQSLEGISSANLPYVFFEDVSNAKSVFVSLGDWSSDLVAGRWTRLSVPMSLFLGSGDGVNYTQIKTTGFAQQLADGETHTLLIDNIRVNVGDGSGSPVSPPARISATGYELHVEISWEASADEVSGYVVERSSDGGASFDFAGQVGASDTLFMDWVKELGTSLELSYRVRALNEAAEASDPSPQQSAQTRNMSDEELLDMVQAYTFRYFWDHAHEASGASRERNTSGNTVTSGGTGFGIMAIPVGIERGFISREEGVTRVLKILDFLEGADRFHGAWSHWINGNTGRVIPFSPKDNGGDIVETSFVAQALLTIRQYFTAENSDEARIVQKATALWEGIEWDWYRRNNSSSMYWHWSPQYNWDMNMTVRGWNEAAIVYLCAIASPTHGVPASMWDEGWAANSNYVNGKIYYGHRLHVGTGYNYGGPLFFAHYSFLGFDPRDKADAYANYFEQNRSHSLIQQAYCKSNLKGHQGYSEHCWGLTASDDPDGYLAHEPNTDRDNGTITPTAALSSFPYTPAESMLALKHFYRELGNRTWGPMGFFDAFNQNRSWWADSYLAIDQGPIMLMIENHRSALLWDLFMANEEVQSMTETLFHSSPNALQKDRGHASFSMHPNPASKVVRVDVQLDTDAQLCIQIYTPLGQLLRSEEPPDIQAAGRHVHTMDVQDLAPGLYFTRILLDGTPTESRHLIIH
jgi:hypothetical protein